MSFFVDVVFLADVVFFVYSFIKNNVDICLKYVDPL